nr:thiamine pyrophosphate-dependent enzyme [Zhaonella formicivorans]
MSVRLIDLPEEEFVAHGRGGCPGCAAVIGARMATKISGKKTIMINSTGCMCVNYGYNGAPLFPYVHSLFENAGSVISGIDAALKALGRREDVNLIVYAGDGGTVDIGFQALSGAVDRGHRFLYICYDNEGYMNTGVQRSGATPYGASTTTTPVGAKAKGEPRPLGRKKDMVRVMAAHGIPYTATASIAYPLDYMRKVQTALQVDGPSYIHLLSPCSPGWGIEPKDTVTVARLAVQTNFAPLYEITGGAAFKVNIKPQKPKPVREYLATQKRFRHLLAKENESELELIQQAVDARFKYLLSCENS